jgi:hypothetical protein
MPLASLAATPNEAKKVIMSEEIFFGLASDRGKTSIHASD